MLSEKHDQFRDRVRALCQEVYGTEEITVLMILHDLADNDINKHLGFRLGTKPEVPGTKHLIEVV